MIPIELYFCWKLKLQTKCGGGCPGIQGHSDSFSHKELTLTSGTSFGMISKTWTLHVLIPFFQAVLGKIAGSSCKFNLSTSGSAFWFTAVGLDSAAVSEKARENDSVGTVA